MTNQPISIILRSAPYSSSQFKEGLDIALASCAFDRQTNLILEDDACYILLDNQDPKQISQKNLLQVMKSLPIYGLEEVFACKESLLIRGIDTETCPIRIKALSDSEKADCIRQSSTAISF